MNLLPRAMAGFGVLRLWKARLACSTNGELASTCELICRPKTVRAITSIVKAPVNLEITQTNQLPLPTIASAYLTGIMSSYKNRILVVNCMTLSRPNVSKI